MDCSLIAPPNAMLRHTVFAGFFAACALVGGSVARAQATGKAASAAPPVHDQKKAGHTEQTKPAEQEQRARLAKFLKPFPAGKTTRGTKKSYEITVPTYKSQAGFRSCFSHDLKKQAFTGEPPTSAINIGNMDGSTAHEVQMNLNQINPLDFSPGSKRLLLIGKKGSFVALPTLLSDYSDRLWQYSMTNGSVTQVSPPNLFVSDAKFSPNGKQIAFTAIPFSPNALSSAVDSAALQAASNVYLIGSDGKGLQQLHRGSDAVCWSPSGRRIAFLVNSEAAIPNYQEIWSVDVGTGKARRVYRVSGLSRDAHSPETKYSKNETFARYTFNHLAWLNENELVVEATWGKDDTYGWGLFRLNKQGRILATLPDFLLSPLSASAFFCTVGGDEFLVKAQKQ